MKKTFLFIILFLTISVSTLYSTPYEYKGVYYNLNKETKEAEVTRHPDKYEWNITIPSHVFDDYTVTSIGEEAFADCPNLWSVQIPSTVTVIRRHAFALSGVSLEKVSIPQSITIIEDHAFYGCTSLKSIILPEQLIFIGNEAFGDCSSLTTIYCYCNSMPQTEGNIFMYTDISQISLYVYESDYDQYSSTEPWKNFKEIITMPLSKISTESNDPIQEKPLYTTDGILHNHPQKGVNILPIKTGHSRKIIIK